MEIAMLCLWFEHHIYMLCFRNLRNGYVTSLSSYFSYCVNYRENFSLLFLQVSRRNIMGFQEYIILIWDFNIYTVFMHNTFCALSSGFWTLIQNIRSSGIGWLTWSPWWWTAMTWWCQRISSSIFTRLEPPFLPCPAVGDLISLTILSLRVSLRSLYVSWCLLEFPSLSPNSFPSPVCWQAAPTS